jgi:hypothetical protein
MLFTIFAAFVRHERLIQIQKHRLTWVLATADNTLR